MKRLLLVYHSKTGRNARLAKAVAEGVRHEDLTEIELRVRTARQAGPDDLLWANAVIFGGPENFGYMSGALKDFFDRTFYEVEGRLPPLPCALFICSGNDGTGALRAIRRILPGYGMREVQPEVLVRGEPTVADLGRCHDLGLAMAVGLDAGIW